MVSGATKFVIAFGNNSKNGQAFTYLYLHICFSAMLFLVSYV